MDLERSFETLLQRGMGLNGQDRVIEALQKEYV